jgi:integrase
MEVLADRSALPTKVDITILERLTLGDLVVRYAKERTSLKRGADTEQIVLTALLRHSICLRKLRDLRPEDFASYRDERLKVVAPSTVKRQLGTIRNLFEVARSEWGIPLPSNPLTGLTLSDTDTRRERRLKPGEFERLCEAAGKSRNPCVLPIVRLAVETGLRRGEILGIQRDHVAPDQLSLTLPVTKNGHARVIPLSAEARRVLAGLSSNGHRLFPISANAFRLAWERVKARSGVEDLRFHDLRHEAISRFFEKGLSLPEVSLLSGHRDPRMLLRYSHAMRAIILEKLDG